MQEQTSNGIEVRPTAQELDAAQGVQMFRVPVKTPSLLDRLASVCHPAESPIAIIMGTMLHPSPDNLARISILFKDLIDKTPEFPDYVRADARAFIASVERWST